jgi:hypothetical protein
MATMAPTNTAIATNFQPLRSILTLLTKDVNTLRNPEYSVFGPILTTHSGILQWENSNWFGRVLKAGAGFVIVWDAKAFEFDRSKLRIRHGDRQIERAEDAGAKRGCQ